MENIIHNNNMMTMMMMMMTTTTILLSFLLFMLKSALCDFFFSFFFRWTSFNFQSIAVSSCINDWCYMLHALKKLFLLSCCFYFNNQKLYSPPFNNELRLSEMPFSFFSVACLLACCLLSLSHVDIVRRNVWTIFFFFF